MRVIFAPEVETYLNELVDILYHKEYFGFKGSAYDYVEWIIDTIELEIHCAPRKKAPPHFSKYGKNLFYSIFKRNNSTEWYVFYNLTQEAFVIKYIGNNHNCAMYIKHC